MVTQLRVRSFPASRAVHVSQRQGTPQGARDEVKGLVVMPSDGSALLLGEGETALVEDVKRTSPVAAPVPTACLAQVVEQGCHCDGIRPHPRRMGGHVLVHLQRMTRETAMLLVMAVTATGEVVR